MGKLADLAVLNGDYLTVSADQILSLESMLTLVGVIPYADGSLVFAVNHTFTEQVTGIGASVRRSIGRNLVATQLAGQLEETRNRLNR